MRSSIKQLNRLGGLKKLHNTRVRVSEVHCLESKRKRDEAARNLSEREASIFQLRQERSRLFCYLDQQHVVDTPYRAERAHDRRYWLEYDLEKDEYYLEMDRQELDEAESELSQARLEWVRARKRQDLIDQKLAVMRRDISRGIESRETED